LADMHTAQPTFTAPLESATKEYTFGLVVSDGELESSVSEVTITVEKVNGVIKLYPNPSTGVFTLDMGKTPDKPLDMRIMDLNGKAVYNQKIYDQKTKVVVHIAPGKYIISIENDNEKTVKTILIK